MDDIIIDIQALSATVHHGTISQIEIVSELDRIATALEDL
jgi:hypothetical protein